RHTRFKCDWSSDVCSSDLSRTALFWKLFALIGLVQLAALAIDRLPMAERFDMRFDGWISTAATATLVLVLLIWWTGAIAAALRRSEERRVGKECRYGRLGE